MVKQETPMKKNFLSLDVYPLLKLAFPLICTGLIQSAIWFFETLFLAHLGHQSLAAGSLAGWLFGTCAVILFGTLGSINILVSHKHGEKNLHAITLIARDGLILAGLFAVPAFLLFWNVSPIFLLLGQSQTVVELAKPYLHGLAWSVVPNFIITACFEVIIGVGLARVILIFSTLSVFLAILNSYALIFGKFGLPALGVAGAGWGVATSSWITAIVLAIFIFNHPNYRVYFQNIFCFTKPFFLKELIKIGLPMGIMFCGEVAFFFVLTLCMGLLGSQIQAANQIALQYLGLFATIMFSIAQAVTVRMGHLLGANQVHAAEKANYIGIYIAVLSSSILAFLYWFYPNALITIDFNVHDPHNFDIVKQIKSILAVTAIFQILESVRITLFGSLRSLKETNFTLLVSLLSFWLIGLPLGYLLAIFFKTGSTGFWWGATIGVSIGVCLLQWRFKYKIRYYQK